MIGRKDGLFYAADASLSVILEGLFEYASFLKARMRPSTSLLVFLLKTLIKLSVDFGPMLIAAEMRVKGDPVG
jgi:hypothetical protein